MTTAAGGDNLCGFNLVVSSALAGSRRAFRQGNTIYVSPAMLALLSHAKGEELERLLRAIPLLDLGDVPDYLSVDFCPSLRPPEFDE